MRKGAGLLFILLSVLLSTSCSTVTVSTPIKTNIHVEKLKKFEGNWLSDGEVSQITFSENGEGNIGTLVWDYHRELFEAQSYKFTLFEVDDEWLVTGYESDKKEDTEYHLLLIKPDEENVTILRPDVDVFLELVSQKQIAGEVFAGKGAGAYLEMTSKEFINFYKTSNKELFDKGEPVVLKKVNSKPK